MTKLKYLLLALIVAGTGCKNETNKPAAIGPITPAVHSVIDTAKHIAPPHKMDTTVAEIFQMIRKRDVQDSLLVALVNVSIARGEIETRIINETYKDSTQHQKMIDSSNRMIRKQTKLINAVCNY